jgi:hypothetical protein
MGKDSSKDRSKDRSKDWSKDSDKDVMTISIELHVGPTPQRVHTSNPGLPTTNAKHLTTRFTSWFYHVLPQEFYLAYPLDNGSEKTSNTGQHQDGEASGYDHSFLLVSETYSTFANFDAPFSSMVIQQWVNSFTQDHLWPRRSALEPPERGAEWAEGPEGGIEQENLPNDQEWPKEVAWCQIDQPPAGSAQEPFRRPSLNAPKDRT